MNGREVNELMSPESRAKLDEDKNLVQMLIKVNIFDVAFHNLEAAQTSSEITEGKYNFIPFPCGAFVDMLMEAFFVLGQDRKKKFLDIGCGIGTKVILACSLFDAYGIEYNPKDVEKAKLLGMNRVGEADAMSFSKYGEFDFLYYYRPFHDFDLYEKFETMVHKNLKPGALLAPMHSEYNFDSMPDMERISKYLYRKKS
jgi:SAM-dependent methyltransferase